MRFTAEGIKRFPDQTVDELNKMYNALSSLKRSIRVVSDDGKNAIIIGEQPVDPNTGKPYSFGIKTYRIKGDRLEVI